MIFQPHDIKCASVVRLYCVNCIRTSCSANRYFLLYVQRIICYEFFCGFEINFKFKNLYKVKRKLSLGDGIASMLTQLWHGGEIGFDSHSGYYNNSP
jgi:hypothetical protein